MRVERVTSILTGIFCLAGLLTIVARPAYAGDGTIRETDTQIYVEYSGDDKDIQDGIKHRDEVQRHQQQVEEQKARLQARRDQKAETNVGKMKNREE